MRADYRTDRRSRCDDCASAVAHEELVITLEGKALCPSCHRRWFEQDYRATFLAGGKRKPGYRLVCPACRAATMETIESEMRLRATCVRCGASTRRFRAAAALLPMLLFMISVFVDAPRGAPVVSGILGVLLAVVLAFELVGRRRHPVATFEQIQEADAALRGERVRIATGRAVAADGPLALAEAEARAETEAEADATAQQERRVS